jgi:hypothetical protein
LATGALRPLRGTSRVGLCRANLGISSIQQLSGSIGNAMVVGDRQNVRAFFRAKVRSCSRNFRFSNISASLGFDRHLGRPSGRAEQPDARQGLHRSADHDMMLGKGTL